MPNLVNIPASTLAVARQESLTTNETQINSKSQDWFYGTEELLDALPKVWTRSLLYFLVGFTTIVLPWTMLAQVDETGTSIGRIEPKGATQKLDSAVTGSVISVNVKEGVNVRAGEVLLKLESNLLLADLRQTQTKLESLVNSQSQLELMKTQLLMAINIQERENQSQKLEKLAQLNQVRQNLADKKSAYNLQKLEKLAHLDQAKQTVNSAQVAYKLAQSHWGRDLWEIARYRSLLLKGAIPQIKLVELEKTGEDSQRLAEEAKSNIHQTQLRFQEELSRYQSATNQAESDIKLAQLRFLEEKNSYQSAIQAAKLTLLKSQEDFKNLQTKITSVKSDISQTQSQIISLKFQLQQRTIRSPINGTIFELPVKKPGAVVQTGQMVALIAPENAVLILKAHIPSQQSGFLKPGMPVKIKFDAYPFQEYGILQGYVTWISPDSKIQENSPQNVETYDVDIALEHPYIQAGNKRINLTPGQTATAEIIIRQRRIIDFILDPFKKLQSNGLNF